MRSIWRESKSSVEWNDKAVDMNALVSRMRKDQDETLFFMPAQRVLTMRDGWPRPFSDYSPGDPFTVREFSERLRQLVDEFGSSAQLFPQERRLKQEFRDLLEKHVFSTFPLKIHKFRSQKRLVLGANELPFMVWSAGQREFVPLLLGMYWLMPPTKVSRRRETEWVVLEELEMGLHPARDFGRAANGTGTASSRLSSLPFDSLAASLGSHLGTSPIAGQSGWAKRTPFHFRRSLHTDNAEALPKRAERRVSVFFLLQWSN